LGITKIKIVTKNGTGIIETDNIKTGAEIKKEFKAVKSGTK